MRVLGIGSDIWISSAALVEDGRVVAAAPEERFDRRKMSKAFPHRAIDYCLEAAGCAFSDLDAIAFGWSPAGHMRRVSGRYLDALRWRGEYLYMVPASLVNHFGTPRIGELEQHLATTDWQQRIVYVNHHAAHAACAFSLSPFEDAAVFTMDGRGDEDTCSWNVGGPGGIERLQSVREPHSLGLLYGTITDFLGFKPHSDEWKVMALASYGAPDSEYHAKLRPLVNLLDDGRFELDLGYLAYALCDAQPRMFTDKMVDLLEDKQNMGESVAAIFPKVN